MDVVLELPQWLKTSGKTSGLASYLARTVVSIRLFEHRDLLRKHDQRSGSYTVCEPSMLTLLR